MSYQYKTTQHNSLNVKLLQLNKSKWARKKKNEKEVVLRLSSNKEGNSDSETNFSHKLSLTNTQVANLHQAFANYLSTYTKLSKTQLSKMVQWEDLLVYYWKQGYRYQKR